MESITEEAINTLLTSASSQRTQRKHKMLSARSVRTPYWMYLNSSIPNHTSKKARRSTRLHQFTISSECRTNSSFRRLKKTYQPSRHFPLHAITTTLPAYSSVVEEINCRKNKSSYIGSGNKGITNPSWQTASSMSPTIFSLPTHHRWVMSRWITSFLI